MKNYTLKQQYEWLENNGVPKHTLDCITSIYGFNQKTIDNIIYYEFGLNDFEQLMEEVNYYATL